MITINVILFSGGNEVRRWEDVQELSTVERHVTFYSDGNRYTVNGCYVIERIISN